MVTIDIQQLHDETERFVRQAREQEIQVEAGGTVVAVLSRPRVSGDFEAYWRQREAALSAIRLSGTWDSGEAISADRERP
jgi:hypothetical protein